MRHNFPNRLALALSCATLFSLPACNRSDTSPSDRLGDAPEVEASPLARPNGPDVDSHAAMRFERLESEQTGIDFIIRWDKPAEYDRLFHSQNTGGGVTLGDYDGDGRCDIYLTRPSAGNRLYRNLGDFRFQDVTDRAGLRDDDHWGTGASFVDIDSDGDLDLFACGYACPNRLYINQGDGSFVERAREFGLDFNGASEMMAFADYDRDGDLDAYLTTAGLPPGPEQKFRVRFVGDRPVVVNELREYWKLLYLPDKRARQVDSGQYDHLFRNDGPDADGNMRFTDVSGDAGIGGTDFGQAATWWDYNDDGYPDLYVSNDYWGADILYRNDQDGTFTDVSREAFSHTPWSSMGADVADINGDGRLDFMATDMLGTNHFRQKVGMGEMGKSGWFLEYGEPRQYSRNAVYLNTGAKRFMEVAHLTGLDSTDWTWTARFDDLDNDGLVDLLITNGQTREFTNSDLNKVAVARAPEGTPEFFRFWREQDFRRDRNLMYRNRGDLQFEDVSQAWGFDRLGVSFGAATADLDGDGDLDVVVNNMDVPACIYRNNSTEGNCLRIRLEGRQSNRQGLGAMVRVQAGDQKQVQYMTLSRGWFSTSEPIVHFGLGASDKADRLSIEWPSGHVQELTDLAANQLYTIREPAGDAAPARAEPVDQMFEPAHSITDLDLAHQEVSFDDFAEQPLLPNKMSQLGPGMACGDVNGDGRADFYLSGATGQPGQLIVSDSRNAYRKSISDAFQVDADREDMGALFFDIDGDGDQDLYVVSGGGEYREGSPLLADRMYLNDGAGEFTRAPPDVTPDLRFSGGPAVAADFDRDGDLDVYVGGRVVPGHYPTAPRSALLRNDNGTFIDVTESVAGELKSSGMVTGAVFSDVDDDGWLDLLVTHEWGPVRLYQNRQGSFVERTAEAGLDRWLGWWNSIAAGDVDNDGDMDYAVTNFGLNTKYHASQEHPTSIYYGDYDGSGAMQIVEAEFEGDTLYPVRGKSCSTAAMPFLADKFNSFESFAVAELADIYTPQCLQSAQQFTANTLQSGTLINDGQGRFDFRPWPRIAQAAPGYGLICTDVDGDGNLDIYVVQNFYTPQRETGRMDGGVSQLLLGNGDGTFRAMSPADSGLVVPGDAKSLVMADINGDRAPDFLVGRNDDTALGFTRSSAPAQRYVSLKLRGRPGNPTAVGSRVQVNFENGSQSTTEIHAGSGYLSQSASDLFITLKAGSQSGIQISSIDVRWPDGTESTHAFVDAADVIEIEQTASGD